MAGHAVRIPETTVKAQRDASDPQASAWVRANAGAGKTYVLAQRVLRLLLSGADPARLLCITYTKAAAAEMSNRVFAWLSAWATASDAELIDAIGSIEGRRPSPETLARARRLFAAAVETPGGLKIQTIHAFCERLLQQFPFEASLTAGFAVLDERASAELLAEAQAEVLAGAGDDGRILGAIDALVTRLSDGGFADVVRAVLGKRSAYLDWVRTSGDLEDALQALGARLGLGPGEDEAAVTAAILNGPHLPRSEWEAVAAALREGSANDQKAADRLVRALVAPDAAGAVDAYLEFFLTDGSPRKAIVTKAIAPRHQALAERLDAEMERVIGLCDKLAAARLHGANAALFTVADLVIGRYQALKGARGVVDFDDLVERTAMLLGRADAGWILFKLDGGLDHVLVDEAQDTSPRQWEIVAKMSAEFFAGEGARAGNRTVFAVGDVKQSIYSFQGAEPARFSETERQFQGRAGDAGGAFRSVPLRLSFRSTPAVLKAVDTVFERGPATGGVVLDDGEPVIHEALRVSEPGLVEVWPVVEPQESVAVAPWDAPLDVDRVESPPAILARRIAGTIRRWIDTGERLEATGAPIRPGDIMILVARRNPFAEPMIRALKAAGIPVAGADRLVLTDHIAVMDLMAVGRFALLPEDDLNLAALLKSPLVGLTEDELMVLAIPRAGSLWRALRGAEGARFAEVRARLDDWRRRAGFERPYEFYGRILGAERGREAFHRRLGAEAFEAIDEFLALALAYERAETPSLPGYLAWLEAAPAEIRRDMDKGRDEVRVMTVHGAKGLEAPIVFLPDTCRGPLGKTLGPVFGFEDGPGAPLVWAPSKKEDCAATRDLRDIAQRRRAEEFNRLLYVAMTRARDRLYIAGYRTSARELPEGSWYSLVAEALSPLVEEAETADGPVWRLVGRGEAVAAQPAAGAPVAPQPAPDWLRRPAARERPPSAPAAPSRLAAHRRATGDDRAAHEARRRGTVLHRLLEALPQIEPAERAAAAQRALSHLAGDWPDEKRAALAGEVLAILEDPAFAPVFASGGRAEVPIAGRTGEGTPLIGQIDRLWVGDDEVLIVDYKSDRVVPGTADAVPAAYLAQIAAYRALALQIWPGRAVRAAILWTAGPALMALPDDLLAAHGHPAPP